jgi:hypothetical protein
MEFGAGTVALVIETVVGIGGARLAGKHDAAREGSDQ